MTVMEQSDAAQCPTLLHEMPAASTTKGNGVSADEEQLENPIVIQPHLEGRSGKRNHESKERIETVRRRSTTLRFQG